MSEYLVTTDNGVYKITVDDKSNGPDFKQAITDPISRGLDYAKSGITNPEKLPSELPTLGAVGGELAGGPLGAAIGAGAGQIGKRIGDLALGNVRPSEAMNPLKEGLGAVTQSLVAGFPGTTQGKSLSKSVGKGLAKIGQAFSGTKASTLESAAKKGYATYGAPSLAKAGEIFSEALGPEGRAAMKQSASDAFDPAVGQARSIATEIGTKIENGEPVTAIEALRARQATDRVISATPMTDRVKRSSLFDWRTKFDDIISSQSGPLKSASNVYRDSVVKDSILKPMRVNKSGDYSALLPMLAGVGSALGGYGGGKKAGIEGAIGYTVGTSPLAAGAVATTLGSINPTVRQALLSKLVDSIISRQGRSD